MGNHTKRVVLGMVVAAVTCAASEGVDLTAKALLEYRKAN